MTDIAGHGCAEVDARLARLAIEETAQILQMQEPVILEREGLGMIAWPALMNQRQDCLVGRGSMQPDRYRARVFADGPGEFQQTIGLIVKQTHMIVVRRRVVWRGFPPAQIAPGGQIDIGVFRQPGLQRFFLRQGAEYICRANFDMDLQVKGLFVGHGGSQVFNVRVSCKSLAEIPRARKPDFAKQQFNRYSIVLGRLPRLAAQQSPKNEQSSQPKSRAEKQSRSP